MIVVAGIITRGDEEGQERMMQEWQSLSVGLCRKWPIGERFSQSLP